MPVYKQYKYDHRGWLEAVEDTLSDREIDLAQYTPPSGYAWEKPPAVQADEVPVWNGKAWEIRKLADYEPRVPSLEERKADKISSLEANWFAAMEEGFTSKSGIPIPCGQIDVVMWDKGLARAAKKGRVEKVVDAKGKVYSDIPAATVQALVEERDEWLYQLWLKKLDRRAAIQAATAETIDAMEVTL